MKIEKNKFVSVFYKLKLNGMDGELIEETSTDNPLQFVFGMGRMIAKFEQNLEGLSAGDTFNFNLEAKDAYGEIDKNAIVDLPRKIFEVNGVIDENILVIGNQIRMQDDSGGILVGKVLEIFDDKIKMDFNHQLAGKNLFFSGTIVEVRNATEEEINPSCSPKSCSSCGGGCG